MRGDVPGTVEEVYRDLLARAPENKMQPRLEPMRRVLALLGDPQHAAPVIHLTGTNGKTSTARMVEAVLRAYGLRTGRYTSPHLRSVTERISIDGAPVADETFVRVWGEILPLVQVVDVLGDHPGDGDHVRGPRGGDKPGTDARGVVDRAEGRADLQFAAIA